MMLASFGGLIALLLAFGAGSLYGWWVHRLERAELRQALHSGADLIASMVDMLPQTWLAARRRPLDFVARWRQR